MVSVGLQATPLVNWLPSDTNKFLMSCVCPYLFTTPSRGLALMRLVPMLWVLGYGGVGKVRTAPTAAYTALPCWTAWLRMAMSFSWSS
jgi:hypothetical protein